MKRIFSILLCALLMAGALTLAACKKPTPEATAGRVAPGPASEGLKFELVSGMMGQHYIVAGMGTCTDTHVIIPDTYNGLPVRGIAAGAFRPTALGGTGTFAEGGLESLSATQLDGIVVATPETRITDVFIPDSVMEIGDEAFYGCSSLAAPDASSLINMIGTDAFKNTAFYLDESNWEGGVLYLEHYLVEVRANVTGTLAVREGTVHIAANAAKGNTGLTGLALPTTMRVIGKNAFEGCTGLVELDLRIPGICIQSNAFRECTALTTVHIGTDDAQSEDFLSIGFGFSGAGADALMNRQNEVMMPQGIAIAFYGKTPDPNLGVVYAASVGSNAFLGCTALTTVTFGKNVGNVGNGAFTGCTSLVSVDLGNIMVHSPDAPAGTIGTSYYTHTTLPGVFTDCTALKEVKLPAGIQYLENTFLGCTALESFTVPAGVKGLLGTFFGCSSLKSVSLPEGLVAMSSTFDFCTALESVTIPESVVKIGSYTFGYCKALTSVTVPDAVSELGDGAFLGLPAYAQISVGRGVATIGEGALTRFYTLTYRGTAAEWAAIEKSEGWGGETPYGDDTTILCTDGKIGDGNIVPLPDGEMRGIRAADGMTYVLYMGITVEVKGKKVYLSERTFSDVEAEAAAAGEVLYLTAEEICEANTDLEQMIVNIVYRQLWGGTQKGDQNQGGGNSGGEEIDTSITAKMKAVKLPSGIVYVEYEGKVYRIKQATAIPEKKSLDALLSEWKDSGTEVQELSNAELAEVLSQKVLDQILAYAEK